MKAAAWELERARERLAEQANTGNTARLMRRANREIDYPIALLHILEGHHALRLPHHSRRPGTWQRPRFAGLPRRCCTSVRGLGDTFPFELVARLA